MSPSWRWSGRNHATDQGAAEAPLERSARFHANPSIFALTLPFFGKTFRTAGSAVDDLFFFLLCRM